MNSETECSTVTDDDDTIKFGTFVIIRRKFESKCFKLVKVGPEKYFMFGKQKINSFSLIGQKFGFTFELTKERDLNMVDISSFEVNTDENKKIETSIEDKDNRNISDNNNSQKLTRDDIEVMKKQSTGTELIQSLVENSATFEGKNKYSQEKYLTKKKQKHLNLFTVLKPNIKFLIEMYFSQSPAKNCYLRIDTLSQMLSACNVMSGGKYMVVDSNLGIISAAVMERINGNGTILQIHTEDIPNGSSRQAVHALNYSEDVISQSLYSINFNDVADVLNEQNGNSLQELEQNPTFTTKKERRLYEIEKAKSILRNKDLDGLLLLTKNYDPSSLVAILIEFLGQSRTFAIFCSSIEPLKECYVQLKKRAIFLRISETWMRRYQVLSERTHPEMTMNASSGYLLSGIKVDS